MAKTPSSGKGPASTPASNITLDNGIKKPGAGITLDNGLKKGGSIDKKGK